MKKNNLGSTPLSLTFYDPELERTFLKNIRRSNILQKTYFIMLLLFLFLIVGHAVNGCFHTIGNRIILGACVLVCLGKFVFLYYFDMSVRFATVAVVVAYSLPFFFSTFIDSSCDNRAAEHYTSVIWMCYMNLMCISSQLGINIAFRYRLIILTGEIVFAIVTVPIHKAIYDDHAVEYSAIFIFIWLTF